MVRSRTFERMRNLLKPVVLCQVSVHDTRLNPAQLSGKCLIAMTSLMLVSFGISGSSEAGDAVTATMTHKVVAAGIGFQNADSSSITVKTYDADSGEVLSNESYDLDIKEEGPAIVPPPRERIFAGGVGMDADGLAEFMLGVYDAEDGRFVWEGRLNLRESSTDANSTRVAATIRPRAVVRRIVSSTVANGQPFFLLRVRDLETGQLVWFDRFSTEGVNLRVEHVSRSVSEATTSVPQDIDFRIQMFDQVGGRLLWEDQVTSIVEGTDSTVGQAEDEAGTMRQWSPKQGDADSRQTI